MSIKSIQAQSMRDAGVRPLAKSLHTVTAIVKVAHFFSLTEMAEGNTPEMCIEAACGILGVKGMPDVYDLKGQALKQLSKAVKKQAATV